MLDESLAKVRQASSPNSGFVCVVRLLTPCTPCPGLSFSRGFAWHPCPFAPARLALLLNCGAQFDVSPTEWASITLHNSLHVRTPQETRLFGLMLLRRYGSSCLVKMGKKSFQFDAKHRPCHRLAVRRRLRTTLTGWRRSGFENEAL